MASQYVFAAFQSLQIPSDFVSNVNWANQLRSNSHLLVTLTPDSQRILTNYAALENFVLRSPQDFDVLLKGADERLIYFMCSGFLAAWVNWESTLIQKNYSIALERVVRVTAALSKASELLPAGKEHDRMDEIIKDSNETSAKHLTGSPEHRVKAYKAAIDLQWPEGWEHWFRIHGTFEEDTFPDSSLFWEAMFLYTIACSSRKIRASTSAMILAEEAEKREKGPRSELHRCQDFARALYRLGELYPHPALPKASSSAAPEAANTDPSSDPRERSQPIDRLPGMIVPDDPANDPQWEHDLEKNMQEARAMLIQLPPIAEPPEKANINNELLHHYVDFVQNYRQDLPLLDTASAFGNALSKFWKDRNITDQLNSKLGTFMELYVISHRNTVRSMMEPFFGDNFDPVGEVALCFRVLLLIYFNTWLQQLKPTQAEASNLATTFFWTLKATGESGEKDGITKKTGLQYWKYPRSIHMVYAQHITVNWKVYSTILQEVDTWKEGYFLLDAVREITRVKHGAIREALRDKTTQDKPTQDETTQDENMEDDEDAIVRPDDDRTVEVISEAVGKWADRSAEPLSKTSNKKNLE